MSGYLLDIQDVDRTRITLVGGKAANLGELSQIEGIHVPDGFCITTNGFRRMLAEAPLVDDRLDRLSRLRPNEREAIRALSAEIRRMIEAVAVPDDLAAAITRALRQSGEQDAYAVRSSATAEDLPSTSFAGQMDSYLNVVGPVAILRHVRRCWASLFTERAVIYRLRKGLDHREARMAVVVQRMAVPRAAGVIFTADPVTSNRSLVSVEASLGLGEALVLGLVNADVYTVRDGEIVDKAIASKRIAIQPSPEGGTRKQPVEAERQAQPALTDSQVVQLARLGRRIEAHFGRPQDIEWCLTGDGFRFVQTRPITTLFPVPAAGDRENHVYVSVGHQQMMTDPMRPLGLSLFQLTAARPMLEAGGRLFVDVTRELASPAIRPGFMAMMGTSDPLIGNALQTIIGRADFIMQPPAGANAAGPGRSRPWTPQPPVNDDPAIVEDLIRRSRASVEALKRNLQEKSGPDLLDCILEDVEALKQSLADPQNFGAIVAGMSAATWLDEQMLAWLGEKGAAAALSQSVPNNITSEMGLALLDVADVIRRYPEVMSYLRRAEDADFWEGLMPLPGGPESHDAFAAYLDRYGMRCTGEIDVTRTRWSEKPTMLVPLILSNIKAFAPGEGSRRFEQGRLSAANYERSLLDRLKQLPDGDQKAAETQRMVHRLRNFIGYREYPKYGMINRYFVYKQALLKEAVRLVEAHVIREKGDIYYLTLQELREAAHTSQVNEQRIQQRKDEFRSSQALTPPRVITSDGEIIPGEYRRGGVPAGALPGLPVSTGTVEGRARVILHMTEAALEPGDILVTAYTDPSWTPLFIAIRGLVTEVGGLMTHGAVIAREYGLPAVVGVENATRLIRDGQRIRVNGADGYVEILP